MKQVKRVISLIVSLILLATSVVFATEENQVCQNSRKSLGESENLIIMPGNAQSEYALEFCETPEEYREALQVIERQGKKMSDIISQLLFFTRLTHGTEIIQKEQISLSSLVQGICEEQKGLSQKNICLISDIQEDIYVGTDRILLERCLNNLLSNAYKYGRENGHVWVRLRRNADKIILSVKDDGIGISQENLTKIWERFYQADSARGDDRSDRGLGLGLSMVKQICELLGITVEADSTLGKGSEFILIF